MTGLDLYLDPTMLDKHSAEHVRAVLKNALAALDNKCPGPVCCARNAGKARSLPFPDPPRQAGGVADDGLHQRRGGALNDDSSNRQRRDEQHGAQWNPAGLAQ